jgi:hypothetical protein
MTGKIMIIRHGEKPGTPIAADGVDPYAGLADDGASLTAAGWRRARALAGIFNPAGGAPPAGLAIPTALFAAAVTDPDSSKRPLQTLLPLALTFDPPLPIDASIAAGNAAAIADAAKNAGGVVLIAWKHEHIFDIAALLAPAAAVPAKWPKSRFDVVFVFDLVAGTYQLSQVMEHALPTDSDMPL